MTRLDQCFETTDCKLLSTVATINVAAKLVKKKSV